MNGKILHSCVCEKYRAGQRLAVASRTCLTAGSLRPLGNTEHYHGVYVPRWAESVLVDSRYAVQMPELMRGISSVSLDGTVQRFRRHCGSSETHDLLRRAMTRPARPSSCTCVAHPHSWNSKRRDIHVPSLLLYPSSCSRWPSFCRTPAASSRDVLQSRAERT